MCPCMPQCHALAVRVSGVGQWGFARELWLRARGPPVMGLPFLHPCAGERAKIIEGNIETWYYAAKPGNPKVGGWVGHGGGKLMQLLWC